MKEELKAYLARFPQFDTFTHTCGFNVVLIMLFFSEGCRKLISSKLHLSQASDDILNIILNILSLKKGRYYRDTIRKALETLSPKYILHNFRRFNISMPS